MILTHSYSHCVSQAIIHTAKSGRKRISVYVTETPPFGLGVKTCAVLTKAGIPCEVILDSASAFIAGRCDIVVRLFVLRGRAPLKEEPRRT